MRVPTIAVVTPAMAGAVNAGTLLFGRLVGLSDGVVVGKLEGADVVDPPPSGIVYCAGFSQPRT